MNFDFSDDQKQMRDAARKFLSEQCPPKAVRAVLDGKAAYDKELWKGLAEMGFLGVAIPEEFGGAGAGHLELCVIAEEMGRALAPVPFSSTVYLAAETLLLAGDLSSQKAFQRAVMGALGGHPAAVMHYPVERDTLFDLVAIGVGVTVCEGATTGAFYPGVCFKPIDRDQAQIDNSLMWTQAQPSDALSAFIALAQRLAHEETSHG